MLNGVDGVCKEHQVENSTAGKLFLAHGVSNGYNNFERWGRFPSPGFSALDYLVDYESDVCETGKNHNDGFYHLKPVFLGLFLLFTHWLTSFP